MKAQINLTDIEKDGKPGVELKLGSTANGVSDANSPAMSLRNTLALIVQIINHPQAGPSFGATVAAYDALVQRLNSEAQNVETVEEELPHEG